MLKLKRKLRASTMMAPSAAQERKPVKKRERNTLPSDAYRDEIEPVQIDCDEYSKVSVAVKRRGEYGLAYLDLRHWQTTSVYTGFTQRALTIPVAQIGNLIETLEWVRERVAEKKLDREWDDG
jgi:hypothetical protein